MSLVNEALKRADEENGQRVAGVTPPGPPTADEPPRRWLRRLLVALCVVALVAGTAAYGIWWAAGRFLTQATAAVDDLKQQSAAAFATSPAPALPVATTVPRQAEPPDRTPALRDAQPHDAGPTDPAGGTQAVGPGAQVAPELVKQIAMSVMAQMNLPTGDAADPAAKGGADRSPADDTSTQPPHDGSATMMKAAKPAPAVPATPPAADAPPADAGAQAKAPAPNHRTAEEKAPAPGTPKVADGKKPGPSVRPPQPTPPDAETRPSPPPPVDTSHLKVSSIVCGPQGGTAIINGRPVRVGDTVGGAKIITITPRSVVVEIDGRRVTLALG